MTRVSGLRVLMTTDAVGGVWVFSLTLARALAQRGAKVIVATLGPVPRDEQLAELRAIDGVEIVVTDFALEWMDPEAADFERARDGLASFAARVQPDLVHLNGYREALVEWCVPVLVTAHSCVKSWWLACRGEEPSEPRWETYVENVAAGLASADLWIAPTAAFRDRIQALYSPPRAGLVIHNGVDVGNGHRNEQPFILAAGRLWDEAKNVRAVMSAAEHAGWPLKLAGPWPAQCDLPAGLEFLGDLPRQELLDLMARAGIFVAPALYEPFGFCVLEAAGSGCALVLSDIPGFRELWNGAAVFVDPSEPGALASATRRLCRDDAMRRRLASAAVRRARRYTPAMTVQAYCTRYRELITASARSNNLAQLTLSGGRA
jgi:glycosyltransferase involved in cell wall biosynthesis